MTDAPKTSQFAEDDRLAFYAGSRFLFVCPHCQHGSEITATDLMKLKGGAARIADIVATMRCSNCSSDSKPVASVVEPE